MGAILYSFRRCPYAMRARMALWAAEKQVELREVVLRDKPAHMLEISPKGTVPVLQLETGEVIDESYEIMTWALGQNDPHAWLPEGEGARSAVDEQVARCESEFKPHLDRYKYAPRFPGADPMEHRGKASEFLMELSDKLANRTWLAGDKMGLADAALAPFVRQFAATDREWFASQSWAPLLAWLERFLSSSAFVSVMKKYPQWNAGDAATFLLAGNSLT